MRNKLNSKSVWDQVSQVDMQVCRVVRHQVLIQVQQSIRNHVRSQVWNQIRDQVLELDRVANL